MALHRRGQRQLVQPVVPGQARQGAVAVDRRRANGARADAALQHLASEVVQPPLGRVDVAKVLVAPHALGAAARTRPNARLDVAGVHLLAPLGEGFAKDEGLLSRREGPARDAGMDE